MHHTPRYVSGLPKSFLFCFVFCETQVIINENMALKVLPCCEHHLLSLYQKEQLGYSAINISF